MLHMTQTQQQQQQSQTYQKQVGKKYATPGLEMMFGKK